MAEKAIREKDPHLPKEGRCGAPSPGQVENSSDEANNARLLEELAGCGEGHRGAKFICCIAVARRPAGGVLSRRSGGGYT